MSSSYQVAWHPNMALYSYCSYAYHTSAKLIKKIWVICSKLCCDLFHSKACSPCLVLLSISYALLSFFLRRTEKELRLSPEAMCARQTNKQTNKQTNLKQSTNWNEDWKSFQYTDFELIQMSLQEYCWKCKLKAW